MFAAAAAGLIYILFTPASRDIAAQLLRARLFGAAPFGLWNNWWFGGQYTPAYSVLFPPLGWLLGPWLLGALAATAGTACVAALVRNPWAAGWFALGTATELASGRVTLMLGLALAAATLLACARERWWLVAALSVLTALGSPVAVLVLLCAAVGTRRLTLAVGVLPLLVLSLGFPTGGYEPFAFSEFWPVCALSLVLGLLASGPLRVGLVVYAAGCAGAFLIHTPVGGNVAQLGQLALGPVAVVVLTGRRRWLLALGFVPLMWLCVHQAVVDVRDGQGDPSTSAAYYRPLISFLRARGDDFRVEVPFTAEHWESYELAPSVPLARGWERQADIGLNPLFYGAAPLTRATYEAWLHRLAVRYVAVPDVALDYSAHAEARLARGFRRVAEVGHWDVYAVPGATRLVSGGARLVHLGADRVTLSFASAGSALVRVRYSSLWRVPDGAVVNRGGFCEVTVRHAGTAAMTMGL